MPQVTVLMSVYNGEEYIRDAIESILCQAHEDFEFLIIDDASSDKSVEIIRSFEDNRITLVQNEENKGLTRNLNEGLKKARGEYIVRLDADDIAREDRLAVQVAFMEANPEVVLAGSWFETLPSREVMERPTDHDKIYARLFFLNPISHPTVILRKDFFQQHDLYYDERCMAAQDYELWSRVVILGQMANIGQPLLQYREHDHQVSVTKRPEQIKAVVKARMQLFRSLTEIAEERFQEVWRKTMVDETSISYEDYRFMLRIYSSISSSTLAGRGIDVDYFHFSFCQFLLNVLQFKTARFSVSQYMHIFASRFFWLSTAPQRIRLVKIARRKLFQKKP